MLPADPAAAGAERQQRLVELLACPTCHGPLKLLRATELGGAIVDADLCCGVCGEVGVIRSYKPSFHNADLGDAWFPAGYAAAPVDLDVVERTGDWSPLSLGVLGTSIGACLTSTTEGAGIAFTLGTHDWGAAGLASCGNDEHRVELFSREPGSQSVVIHRPDQVGIRRRWSLVVAPGASPGQHGERAQAVVRHIAEIVPADLAPPIRHVPSNRGNPYPPRLAELLAASPPDATILDLGGGDRCHDDPRVLNFEYMRYENADFYGDGLHLPIADNAVDLILSQAVLEHVPDPQRAVDEMHRVLRPGGRVYAEFAFMQPLHAVPYHFFNITPHGAALLFAGWEVRDTGVFGGLQSTLTWFFQLVGANRKLGEARAQAVLDTLADLDGQLSSSELEFVASAVYVDAFKPGSMAPRSASAATSSSRTPSAE
jgi:SAM-dependent methyltransferase/uncharacterized protein YbaR (Trm112 family)